MTLGRIRLASLGLVVASIAVSCALIEIGARVWVWRELTAKISAPPAQVWSYDASPFLYSRAFGVDHPVNRVVHAIAYEGGRFTKCYRMRFGPLGSQSEHQIDYASADLKVLAFGDSFTQIHHEGRAWPDFFAAEAGRQLGVSVSTINFGRAGTGVLQMLDMAAAKVEELRPDLVIIAFIVNDLTRARHWWHVVEEGDMARMVRTPTPDLPPPDMRAYHPGVVLPDADEAFCQRMEATAWGERPSSDPITQRVHQEYQTLRRASAWVIDPYVVLSPRVSFAVRLALGDALQGAGRRPDENARAGYNALDWRSFDRDPQTVENAARLRRSGAKIVLLHLPILAEYRAGKLRPDDDRTMLLIHSLEAMLGVQTRSITEGTLERGIGDGMRYVISETDQHPSAAGVELIGDTAAQLLVQDLRRPHPCIASSPPCSPPRF